MNSWLRLSTRKARLNLFSKITANTWRGIDLGVGFINPNPNYWIKYFVCDTYITFHVLILDHCCHVYLLPNFNVKSFQLGSAPGDRRIPTSAKTWNGRSPPEISAPWSPTRAPFSSKPRTDMCYIIMHSEGFSAVCICTGWATKVSPRFGGFCCCWCLPFLPQFCLQHSRNLGPTF